MNTDIDIVTITRVLADGSHVSLGDSSSTIEQIVAALDAMTEGKEVVDDIFTHHTITIVHEGVKALPKRPPIKMPAKKATPNETYFSSRYLVF